MAEAFPQGRIEEDDLMTCGFCKKKLVEPILLPCQHSCCVNCLEEKVTQRKLPLSCPTCETPIDLQKGGVHQLPDNFLFAIIQEQRTPQADTNAKCLPCQFDNKDIKATHKCLDCQDTFCPECKVFHQKFSTNTRNHKIVEIKDIQAGRYTKELQQKKVEHCSKHSSSDRHIPLEFHCEQCQTLVCQHCVILEHKSHNCDTLDAFDDKARPALRKTMTPLAVKKDKEAIFSGHLDSLLQIHNEEKIEAENKVHNAAAELHDLVDKVKEDKLEKIKIHYDEQIIQIQKTKSDMELLEKRTKAVQSFAETFISHSSKVDFASHYRDVDTKVKECIQRKEDYTTTTEHVNIENKPCAEAKTLIENILGEISVTEKKMKEDGKLTSIPKIEKAARTTFQRSAKGPVSIPECSADGKFICIENTASYIISFSGMKIRRVVDCTEKAIFALPHSLMVPAGAKMKIWAKGTKDGSAGPRDIESTVQSWGIGANIVTTLINTNEQVLATHTQRTVYTS